MFFAEPLILDRICEVRIAEERVTAPCRVVIATDEDVTGFSFRIESGDTVLDNRFFGVYDSRGFLVTHVGSDTQSPIELTRPGRCAVTPAKITCTVIFGAGGVLSVSAR